MVEQPVEGKVTSSEFLLSDGALRYPESKSTSSEEPYQISETTISEGRQVFRYYLTPISDRNT